LVCHHRPEYFMFSWLVVGRTAKREILVIPAPITILIAQRRVQLREVRALPGTVSCATAADVIKVLRHH
jgi:hypothetical protein